MRPVVQDVMSYLCPRLPRGAASGAITERYDEVPDVMLNAELLEWSLENLISNAVSALDSRPGTIAVAVTPLAGGGVEITVRDDGRGMSPAEQRRAFEPGYTTKRRGWGLGLALSRRVIEEYHGGRRFIRRSIPGEGTVVVSALRR